MGTKLKKILVLFATEDQTEDLFTQSLRLMYRLYSGKKHLLMFSFLQNDLDWRGGGGGGTDKMCEHNTYKKLKISNLYFLHTKRKKKVASYFSIY